MKKRKLFHAKIEEKKVAMQLSREVFTFSISSILEDSMDPGLTKTNRVPIL